MLGDLLILAGLVLLVSPLAAVSLFLFLFVVGLLLIGGGALIGIGRELERRQADTARRADRVRS